MAISFQQIVDKTTGKVSDTSILYTDESGVDWTIPLGVGNRMEADYDAWVAAGNSPVPPDAPTPQQMAAAIRAQRDAALAGTDWLVTRQRDQRDAGIGTSLTDAQFAELLAYREELRNLPEAPDWPSVTLPVGADWGGM